MKKKITLSGLFNNKRFLLVFSIVTAVLLYLAIAMVENDTRTIPIYNVPVNLESQLQAANLTNLRLEAIEGVDYVVDVKVRGPRTIIGQLNENSPELATTARVNQITESGTYELDVVSDYAGKKDFEIVEYSPATIQVRFDRLVPRTFTIKTDVKGLSARPPFIYDQEYATPDTVTVTGPESDIGMIHSASVELELTEPLESTKSWTCDIILKDAQGEVIDPDQYYFTLSDTETTLFVSVLKETGLPLKIDYQNQPRGFPISELDSLMTTSVPYLTVAGDPKIIDRYTEIYLGAVDIKQLRPGNNFFTFPLELEEGLKASENITSVSVQFEDVDWETARFTVDDIQLVSPPANFEVELMTNRLENVEFVGNKDVLENLTADDIVVEAVLSDRELAPGQYNYPVKISAPGKGLVWAVGDYNAVILVKEKE